MKAKIKKLSTPHSNSVKKLPVRNKSHPSHEPNLEKFFNQMKSDIINEIKKVAELKFNEYKVNFVKILNKSEIPQKKNEAKRVTKSTKSEKKEKKDKTKLFSDDDGSIIVLGTEKSLVLSKSKDKDKLHGKNKKSRKLSVKPARKTKTPSKVEKNNVINLIESPKSLATEPKLSKKSNKRKSTIGNNDKAELIGKKRKRAKEKENFVDLSRTGTSVSSNDKKKRSNSKSQKRPSVKKKSN